MIFYHGTSNKNWECIQKECILFGIHSSVSLVWNGKYLSQPSSNRYTYLSPYYNMAKNFGDIVLKVKYEPKGFNITDKNGEKYDNYIFGSHKIQDFWQFSVFKPILLKNCKIITII